MPDISAEGPESATNISLTQSMDISIPQERQIVIRAKDWIRIRKLVASMKSNERHFAAVAWAAVGFATSAIVSALTWFPAFNQMTDAQKLASSWVGPTLVTSAVAVGALSILMFWAASSAKTQTSTSVDQVLADMDDLHTLN